MYRSTLKCTIIVAQPESQSKTPWFIHDQPIQARFSEVEQQAQQYLCTCAVRACDCVRVLFMVFVPINLNLRNRANLTFSDIIIFRYHFPQIYKRGLISQYPPIKKQFNNNSKLSIHSNQKYDSLAIRFIFNNCFNTTSSTGIDADSKIQERSR